MAQNTADRRAHHVALAAIERDEGRLAVPPERDVQVHRVSGVLCKWLGHEGGKRPAPPCQVADTVLQARRVVGGMQRRGVGDVDLDLPRPVLGVRAFYLDDAVQALEDPLEHRVKLSELRQRVALHTVGERYALAVE